MPSARERPPEEASIDTSFARGLRLLLMIADRGNVRADELGAALEMPVSSVYRYLRTLAEFGFVDRRGGRFQLGPRLHIGSGPTVTSERLIRAADPILHELAAATGETAVVLRRVGLSAVRLHQVEASQPLRVTLDPESQAPLSAGAFGRVLLAWAPADILDGVLATEPGVESGESGDAAEELGRSLRAVVRAGIATSRDVPIVGSVAVAVPILQRDGIVGALGVIGPTSRCDDAWLAKVRRRLPGAARRVARELAAEAPSV